MGLHEWQSLRQSQLHFNLVPYRRVRSAGADTAFAVRFLPRDADPTVEEGFASRGSLPFADRGSMEIATGELFLDRVRQQAGLNLLAAISVRSLRRIEDLGI